jgi:hypothetical protein
MLSIYDDGSTLTQDAAGNVTSLTDNQGNSVPVAGAAGSSLVQQVANLLTYGVRSAIDSRYQTQAAVNARTLATPAPMQTGSLLLLAGLAFVAYKALSK